MAKRLNVRFALYFAGSLAVLGTGTHVLHGYQVRRTAGSLLDEAKQAEADGHLDRTADILGRYVSLKPEDADAQAWYGIVLADKRLATSQNAKNRAWLVLNRVLYRAPDRLDVRRQVVRLALDLGHYGDARAEIESHLLPAFPNDGELKKLLGRCQEATGKYREARQAYEDSVREAPHDLEGYGLLARLFRMHTEGVLRPKEQPGEALMQADRVMNDMVAANGQSFRAYLARANYRRAHGVSDGALPPLSAAARDVARAEELAPDDAEVILTAAELAREQNRPDDASKLLGRGCECHPKDWRLRVATARLETSLGKNDAALACVRQGLRELPRQSELLWELADELATAGPPADAEAAILRLERDSFPPPYLDCLRARLLVRKEQWLAAIVTLEATYSSLIGLTNQPGNELAETLSQQAGISLGRCLEQVGDADRAFDAYSRVVARNERSVPGRLGMAMTRWAQGRLRAALDQYRQLMVLPGAPPAGWVEVARLVLLRTLEDRQQTDVNWLEVDQALTRAEAVLRPPPPTLVVLRAEYWAGRHDYERARAGLLVNYGDPKGRPVEVWVTLAALEEHQGRPNAALGLLDEAQQHCGDGVEMRLARAGYWLRRGRKQAAAGLRPLVQGLDRFTPDQRRRLLSGLGTACREAGLTAEARRLWEQLAGEQPSDLGSRIDLFDLAAGAGDNTAMDRWQVEIRGIEGEDGVLWRFARASALVGRATPGNKSDLAEARRLLSEIDPRRPNWSRVALCEARLNDVEGLTDASLALYLRALQLGERDPAAIGRAVVLLHQRRRDAEATALLSRLPDESLLPKSTQQVAAEVALRAQDKARALARAEAAVAADSKDYNDHLWLGYIYWATGRLDRVEPALLRARELAPAAPEVWLTRVQFLIATGHKDRAVAEVDLARHHLTATAAAPSLAQCHELVGQTDRARELYQMALQASGDDAVVLRAVAGFYLRTRRPQQAQELLLRLSQNADRPAAAWARRTRAVLLAADGNPAKVNEALTLLEGTAAPANSADAAQDQRTRAQLLALQNSGPARREAASLLDGLISRQLATPADHLLAAQMYEAVKDWPRARQRYLGVVGSPDDAGPVALAAAARSLVRHGEVDGAAQALAALDAQAPQSAEAREVRARVLHLQGQTAAAVAAVREWAQAGGADHLAAAAMLEEFGNFAAAEDMYRVFATRSQRPQDVLVLAYFLIRRQRCVEALDICDQAWASCPIVEVAQTSLLALSKAAPDPVRLGRVSARLEAAISRTPDDVNLLAAQAAVFNFQGRFDDAVSSYRRVLQKDPRHATALNNLAWLLALQGAHGREAVDLVNRAAVTVGPGPGLLDTRAIAYLALGGRDAAELAVKDLEETVAEAPSPTVFFHLARAYQSAGRRRDAAKAWQAAQTQGLSVDLLHPLERTAYQTLARTLN